MRTLAQCWPRSFAAGAVTVALIAAARGATAQQTDTNPPLPNVLLLIDNSGSMERMINGNTAETDPSTAVPPTSNGTNACNCVDNGSGVITCATWSTANSVAPAPNRWNILQTAMTGSLQKGFNCVAMPRTPGSTFDEEYHLGQSPYDINYYLPFHRLVAQDTSGGTPGVACVVAPGALPGVTAGQSMGLGAVSGIGGLATDYPSGSIVARQYGKLPGGVNGGPVACSSQTQGAVTGFPQYPDGALTTMRDLMRFGLMTFDSDPDPSTGVTGTAASLKVNTVAPFQGMWTYFPNWNSGGTSQAWSNPASCTAPPQLLAVGARNPGAPPWEGRMVGFQAAATPDLTHQEANNDEIASVILASRPYGATPTAGMFAGAQYYFWTDPTGPQKTDPYVQGNCRNEYIIFITDGAPNLDLQPSCSQSSASVPGTCPFPIPYSSTGTAATLYANGVSTASQSSVQTYVIGFALSDPNSLPINCAQYMQNGSCNCNDPNLPNSGTYGPCCVLECTARNGGTGSAYFAQTQGDLQSALGSILAKIATSATTRTTPAYSPVVTNILSTTSTPTQANESIFLASFNPSPGLPWSGDLQRQRYVCTYSGAGYTIPPPVITNSQGDDFAANLNSGAGPSRTFIAYQPKATATGVVSGGSGTIRPFAAPGVDNVGVNTATMYVGNASAIDTQLGPAALGVLAPCPYTSNVNGSPQQLTTTTCTTMLLDYTFGTPSFAGEPSNFTFIGPGNVGRSGNAFGSIYHATPVVVGPPGSLLQDPGYIGFASQWQAPAPPATFHAATSCAAGSTCRNTVVYAPTNDGLLHAFWADETKLENNELWAMLLPAAMPNINGGSYPTSHAFLADGPPVVKDLVWDRGSGASASGSTSAASDPKAWHTMLVAGYGSSQSGYYAVDVTNPDPTGMVSASSLPTDPWPVGPVFRWQLTTMPSTNMPLFGSHSATPAITTLYMDPDGSGNAREIGVAILPGGEDVVPTTQTSCARQPKLSDANPPSGSGYVWRPNVRCWGNPTPPNPTASGGGGAPPQASTDFVLGRSVTIVRIDTGEILRVFARKQDMAFFSGDTVNGLKRFTDVQLDSPMTGTPIVYPNDVGTDATKFFIGDADGTVWRFDLSSPEPSNWVGEIYLDLYNTTVDTNATTVSWNDGQPLQVPPVLSLDPAGEVVLNVASGTTDQFDTTGIEYVYSITEKVSLTGGAPKLRASVNWWMQPAVLDTLPGERVSGPMTVFNGTLYFATFAAAPLGTQSCTAGTARLWGRDFVTPSNPGQLSLGGLPEMQPPPPNLPTAPPPSFVEPDVYDATLAGKVIPGVSIKATPACANLGTPGNDSYVYGAQHAAPQNYAQTGGYSVFSQVGAKGTGGAATKQVSMAVATPVSPTVIDSWAGVLE